MKCDVYCGGIWNETYRLLEGDMERNVLFTVEEYGMRYTVYWRGIWNEMYCLLKSGKKCTVYCGKEQQAQ